MKSIEDLMKMILEIRAAKPCEKHGRTGLEICTEPGCVNVCCMACSTKGCQCWNDE